MNQGRADGGVSKLQNFGAALVVLAIAASLAAPLLGNQSAVSLTLLLVVAAILLIGRSYGAFSPIVMVVSVSALYALAPGIGILTHAERPLIDPGLYFSLALPLCLLYFLAMLLTYEFQRKRGRWTLAVATRLPKGKRLMFVAFAGVVGSLIYLYSINSDVGLTVAKFDRGEQQLVLTTRSAVLVMLAAAGSLYGLGIWSLGWQAGKRYHWLTKLLLLAGVGIFAFTSVLVLGDRRIFLSTMAGVIAISNPGRRLVRTLLLAVPVGYFSLALYAGFRGAPLHEWAERYEQMDFAVLLDPSQGEFGGWARIAQAVLSRPFAEIADLTFAKAPLSVIPSFLAPDRPLAPSVWFVRTFDPETAARGGAWAFSLVVESFMNFWLLGPVLLGFVVGLLVARLERSTMPRLLVVFVLTFSFRSDLVSIIQQTGWTLVFVSLFYVISRGIRVR